MILIKDEDDVGGSEPVEGEQVVFNYVTLAWDSSLVL